MQSKRRKCSSCQSLSMIYAEIIVLLCNSVSYLLTCRRCTSHHLCCHYFLPFFKVTTSFLTLQGAVWFLLISLQEIKGCYYPLKIQLNYFWKIVSAVLSRKLHNSNLFNPKMTSSHYPLCVNHVSFSSSGFHFAATRLVTTKPPVRGCRSVIGGLSWAVHAPLLTLYLLFPRTHTHTHTQWVLCANEHPHKQMTGWFAFRGDS